jgi:hypothetical protein
MSFAERKDVPNCCWDCRHIDSANTSWGGDGMFGRSIYYCFLNVIFPTKKQTCKKFINKRGVKTMLNATQAAKDFIVNLKDCFAKNPVQPSIQLLRMLNREKISVWQMSKEEFADDAFKRFLLGKSGYELHHNSTIEHFAEFESDDFPFKLKPLNELYEHDVQWYGIKNAAKMWEWQSKEGVDRNWYTGTPNFVEECNYRRKTSAALPFDLKRAQEGNPIQVNRQDDEMFDCKFIKKYSLDDNYSLIQTRQHGIIEALDVDIFMKYPCRDNE